MRLGAHVTADTRSTTKLRRFLIVCCKYMFYQHPHAKWETWKDAWAAFKLEYCFDMVWALDGTRQKAVRTTAGYSKTRLQPIVDILVDYLIENGLEAPDTEAYDAWLQSAPSPGEEFPPMQKLIDSYYAESAKVRRQHQLRAYAGDSRKLHSSIFAQRRSGRTRLPNLFLAFFWNHATLVAFTT